MKYVRLRWASVAILLTVPHVLMFAAGSVWLFEHGWFWHWAASAAALTLLAWALVKLLRAARLPVTPVSVHASGAWSPQGEEAWKCVEALAERVQADADFPLDDPERLWSLFQEVLATVAGHYHPDSDHPELEVPAPHALRIVELVTADLRQALSEHVPGSHVITLNDVRRLRHVARLFQRFYLFYRVLSFGFSPLSSLAREFRQAMGGQTVNASTEEVKQWALGFAVRKTGFYAVQLYSGQLVLDEVALDAFRTERSQSDAASAEASARQLADEPLRILILGQVKSGKSSLVNALFGETRAAVDALPATRGVQPHLLEGDDSQRAVILDTSGYEDASDTSSAFEAFRQQILEADLILLVVSAASAARRPDRQLLDEIRAYFQSRPRRKPPPLVAVVTHVDRLRPADEWKPPYDLKRPTTPKAQRIATAVSAIAEDLALSPDTPIVPVCLAPDRVYNVDKALSQAILDATPEAQRVKYLRCLSHYRTERERSAGAILRQTLSGGRTLLKRVLRR